MSPTYLILKVLVVGNHFICSELCGSLSSNDLLPKLLGALLFCSFQLSSSWFLKRTQCHISYSVTHLLWPVEHKDWKFWPNLEHLGAILVSGLSLEPPMDIVGSAFYHKFPPLSKLCCFSPHDSRVLCCFYMFVCLFICIWMFSLHACLIPIKNKREHQMPWDWSSRQLWAVTWCWELNLGPWEENPVFLTTEPYLQLLQWYFIISNLHAKLRLSPLLLWAQLTMKWFPCSFYIK